MKLFTAATCATLPPQAMGAGYALRLGLLILRDPWRNRAQRAEVRRQIRRDAAVLRAALGSRRSIHPHHQESARVA